MSREASKSCYSMLSCFEKWSGIKAKTARVHVMGYNMINNRNIGNQKMRANRGSLINSWEGLFRAGLKGRPFLTLWSEPLRAAHDRARILIALRTEIENWTRWNALAQKGRKTEQSIFFLVGLAHICKLEANKTKINTLPHVKVTLTRTPYSFFFPDIYEGQFDVHMEVKVFRITDWCTCGP